MYSADRHGDAVLSACIAWTVAKAAAISRSNRAAENLDALRWHANGDIELRWHSNVSIAP
jgi:hypothetical protein